MALRGNLRDFSLPDVFQLVQLSGKTGVLRIAGPEAEGSIWFRDGEVFFAQSNWRREQLGERLVAAQRITPAALARALELRQAEPEGGRRLGEILVNEGYITPQVLETFVQEQIQDTIFDLMRWDEGDFDFEVLPDIVKEDIGLSVSVENIVMEGSRRLEEWQRIKKKVPSTEMVFKMATAPGEGTFEISLKPVEWALLLLIDGTRSVRELAVDTHSTDFDVARVIYGLFSAGLLEVPADEEIERLRADRSRREDKRAKLEAERAAREQEQMAEALSLEAQLTASAETRRQSDAAIVAAEETLAAPEQVSEPDESSTPAVEEAEIEPVTPKHIPEEPEFLAGAGEPASVDDMAVFEQMMASVLSPQAPGEVAEEPPVVEPEFTPELLLEPVTAPELEMQPGIASEFVPEPDFVPEVPQVLELPEDLLPGLDFIPEVPIAPVSEPEPEPEAEGDEESGFDAQTPFVPYAPAFEPEEELAEALELELPDTADMPVSPDAFETLNVAEINEVPSPAIPEDVDLSNLTIAELEALTAASTPEEPVKTGDFEVDLRSLGLGEYPEELLQAQATGEDLLQPETQHLEPPTERRLPMSEIEAGAEAAPAEDDDLDSLLASLGGEAPAGVIASETDFGSEADASGGYISTDAFLAEFDDSGLSSGLGDELTALTGGSAAGRSRPVATVNKIPEAGEAPMLHRDQMVDRSLLEKIIEGIENL